ncbi:MAG: NAD+ synthase, partial [Bacteroidales bacterium]|nr:NAD+ synthase [Bacteroidales bacterium]
YPPQDFLEKKEFIKKCNIVINKIAEVCDNIAAVIGGPVINEYSKGKNLFNAAFFLKNKKIEYIQNKTLLPTYDIFDEYRYFEPNTNFNIVNYKDYKIAITICEDLWYQQPVDDAFNKSKLYSISPMKELMKYNPDFVINIAASPYSHNKEWVKHNVLINNAKQYKLPVFYVNQVGANTELIFDGASMVINKNGEIVERFKQFEEDYQIIDFDKINNKLVIEINIEENKIEKIHNAIILGIKDYFQKSGLKTAVIGLSGGIDSAVTLVLATRALGSENVRVLLMPSKYSSEHSLIDAKNLANNLNVKYDIINIEPLNELFNKSLLPLFAGLPEDIAEENIQSRTRGTLLMAVSNKFGDILLNTSNKSEIAVGYGTLYGDMSGGLSVLGDVYKTKVFELAKYINKEKEIIPDNIIKKPPSAELKPDQKDTDSLPEYDILDQILFNYIELQKSNEEIISLGFDKDLVNKVIRMVNTNEYKRFQTPPILRVTSKGFGTGRRIPLVAKFD